MLAIGVFGGRGSDAQGPASSPAGAARRVLTLDSLSPPGTLARQVGMSGAPATLRSNADGFWRDAAPASAVARLFLQSHNDLCARTGADACLVVWRGRIAAEWSRTDLPDALPAVPATEAFAGLLTMLLIADGKLASPEVQVCQFVSAWCDGSRQRVTLRHLLRAANETWVAGS